MRNLPPLLRLGHLEGWPSDTPVGRFLQHVRAGNSHTDAAIAAGLPPDQVAAWLARGRTSRHVVAGKFATAVDQAEADCRSVLVASVMARAVSDERDAWRAAAWLLEHQTPTAPAPELDDDDDDALSLSAPVRDTED